jgi:hypothetical protein
VRPTGDPEHRACDHPEGAEGADEQRAHAGRHAGHRRPVADPAPVHHAVGGHELQAGDEIGSRAEGQSQRPGLVGAEHPADRRGRRPAVKGPAQATAGQRGPHRPQRHPGADRHRAGERACLGAAEPTRPDQDVGGDRGRAPVQFGAGAAHRDREVVLGGDPEHPRDLPGVTGRHHPSRRDPGDVVTMGSGMNMTRPADPRQCHEGRVRC